MSTDGVSEYTITQLQARMCDPLSLPDPAPHVSVAASSSSSSSTTVDSALPPWLAVVVMDFEAWGKAAVAHAPTQFACTVLWMNTRTGLLFSPTLQPMVGSPVSAAALVRKSPVRATDFTSYMLPPPTERDRLKLSDTVEQLTGITQSFLFNEAVSHAVEESTVWARWHRWLAALKAPVVLAAHYGYRYDFPMLVASLLRGQVIHPLGYLKSCGVIGFFDTYMWAHARIRSPDRSDPWDYIRYPVRPGAGGLANSALLRALYPDIEMRSLHNAKVDVCATAAVMLSPPMCRLPLLSLMSHVLLGHKHVTAPAALNVYVDGRREPSVPLWLTVDKMVLWGLLDIAKELSDWPKHMAQLKKWTLEQSRGSRVLPYEQERRQDLRMKMKPVFKVDAKLLNELAIPPHVAELWRTHGYVWSELRITDRPARPCKRRRLVRRRRASSQ